MTTNTLDKKVREGIAHADKYRESALTFLRQRDYPMALHVGIEAVSCYEAVEHEIPFVQPKERHRFHELRQPLYQDYVKIVLASAGHFITQSERLEEVARRLGGLHIYAEKADLDVEAKRQKLIHRLARKALDQEKRLLYITPESKRQP